MREVGWQRLYEGEEQNTMTKLRIGLLNKKRGNFRIQAKFAGAEGVVD